MATAEEMRKKTEEGILKNIRDLIDDTAEKGFWEVDLADYDRLYLTESMKAELEKDGYNISNNKISW